MRMFNLYRFQEKCLFSKTWSLRRFGNKLFIDCSNKITIRIKKKKHCIYIIQVFAIYHNLLLRKNGFFNKSCTPKYCSSNDEFHYFSFLMSKLFVCSVKTQKKRKQSQDEMKYFIILTTSFDLNLNHFQSCLCRINFVSIL